VIGIRAAATPIGWGWTLAVCGNSLTWFLFNDQEMILDSSALDRLAKSSFAGHQGEAWMDKAWFVEAELQSMAMPRSVAWSCLPGDFGDFGLQVKKE